MVNWIDHCYRKLNDENRYFSDISKQKQLRVNLQYKPLKWFIENVYSDIKFLDEIKNPQTLKIMVRLNGINFKICTFIMQSITFALS